MNTEATEYSKSATDDESARQADAAFNPDITDPQEQKNKAGEGTEGTVSNSGPHVRSDIFCGSSIDLAFSSYSTCLQALM